MRYHVILLTAFCLFIFTADTSFAQRDPAANDFGQQTAEENRNKNKNRGSGIEDDNDDDQGDTYVPVTTDPEEYTVTEILTSNSSVSTFGRLLVASGLDRTFDGARVVTVFAPSDRAFEAMPTGTVDFLLQPENKEFLENLIKHHAIPSSNTTFDFTGRQEEVSSLVDVALAVDGRDGLKVNTSTVIQSDIEAKNGMVHVIDRVLTP
jgi:uncharacterized surface protein with fasciclin (FAS1) repeats